MVYYCGDYYADQDSTEDVDYGDYPNLRGIISFDCNSSETLVDGGVDEVAAALAALGGGTVAPYEVPDAELERAETYYSVYRLAGVPWTYIHAHAGRRAETLKFLEEHEAAALSGRLGGRVIMVLVGEMAAMFGYRFWVAGVLRETFDSLEGEVSFESSDREAEFDEDDGSQFAEDFLLSQDALFAEASFGRHGIKGLKPEVLAPEYEAARFVIGPPPTNPVGS